MSIDTEKATRESVKRMAVSFVAVVRESFQQSSQTANKRAMDSI